MPWGNVTITGQNGRNVYLDGNYDEPCGKGPGPFVVTYGKHTFETLDAKRRIKCSGKTTVNSAQRDVTIELTPVDPSAGGA